MISKLTKKIVAREFLIFLGVLCLLVVELIGLISYNKINDVLSHSKDEEIAQLHVKANKLSKSFDEKTEIHRGFIQQSWPKNDEIISPKTQFEKRMAQMRKRTDEVFAKIIKERGYEERGYDDYDYTDESLIESRWSKLADMAKNSELELEWKNSDKLRRSFSLVGITGINHLTAFLLKYSFNDTDYKQKDKADDMRHSAELSTSEQRKFVDKIISNEEVTKIIIYSFLIFMVLFFFVRYLLYSINWSFKTLKND